MDIVPKATFSKMGIEALKGARPALVTGEGEVIGLWIDPEEVVCLSDLHPTVQRQFKTREGMVRKGMPSPIVLTNREAKEKLMAQTATETRSEPSSEPYFVPEAED